MDHSVEGYLARQSTQTLDRLLKDILSEEISGDYRYVIPVILEILEKRKENDKASLA